MHCARGKKDTKSCIQFHRLTELCEEFFQEASVFNSAFDTQHKSFIFFLVAAVRDLRRVNFKRRWSRDKGVTIRHRLDLASFQIWVKFNSQVWVDFHIVELIDEQLFQERAVRNSGVQFKEIAYRHCLCDAERVGFEEDVLLFEPFNELGLRRRIKFDLSNGSITHDATADDNMRFAVSRACILCDCKILSEFGFIRRNRFCI